MPHIESFPEKARGKCKQANSAIGEALTVKVAADDFKESNGNFSKGNGPIIHIAKMIFKIRSQSLTGDVSQSKADYAIDSIYEALNSVSGRRSFSPIVHHTDVHDMLFSSNQTMKKASVLVEKMMDSIDPNSEFGEELSENEENELLHLNSLLQQLTFGIEDMIKQRQADRKNKIID